MPSLPPRQRVRYLSRPAACGLAIAAGCLLLAGCDDPEIRAYTAPRDAPRPMATLPAPGTDPGGAPPGDVDLHWTVPAGWREAATKQSFTVAAYEAGPADSPTTVTVTRLVGEGGGALSNINRWRGQIGLPPVTELHAQPMERIDAGPMVAGLVDLVAEAEADASADSQPTRIVGALLPRPELGETWFFKMMGPRDALEPLKPQLTEMVRTLHAHAPGHSHGEASPAPAPASGGEGATP